MIDHRGLSPEIEVLIALFGVGGVAGRIVRTCENFLAKVSDLEATPRGDRTFSPFSEAEGEGGITGRLHQPGALASAPLVRAERSALSDRRWHGSAGTTRRSLYTGAQAL